MEWELPEELFPLTTEELSASCTPKSSNLTPDSWQCHWFAIFQFILIINEAFSPLPSGCLEVFSTMTTVLQPATVPATPLCVMEKKLHRGSCVACYLAVNHPLKKLTDNCWWQASSTSPMLQYVVSGRAWIHRWLVFHHRFILSCSDAALNVHSLFDSPMRRRRPSSSSFFLSPVNSSSFVRFGHTKKETDSFPVQD